MNEKENLSQQSELLKNVKELNDTIRDILDNGTLEQKVEFLSNDYKQRMEDKEFQIRQEMQKSIFSSCAMAQTPKF